MADVKSPTSNQYWFNAASATIPGGVNSPARAFRSVGGTPLIAERGEGDLLFDVEGKSYIDYCGSWGALIHGHAHPRIVAAVQKRVAEGSSFGVTTPSEVRLAKKVVDSVPSIEKVRFVSSGTEATMSAVRLARGFTGRDLILKFSGHYHGHADPFLVEAGSGVACLPTSSSSGVSAELVKHTLSIPYNDFEAFEAVMRSHGKKIAAVILEPIAANMGLVLPKSGFLEMLRSYTERVGALLIFDEVISGFRVGLGGAQELFNIMPDLTCLGKIVGGGFPAAAFGGAAEIMDHLAPLGSVYQAGTLSGNPVAMAAGLEALEMCSQPGFYESLQSKTSELVDPIQDFIESENIEATVHRAGSLFTLFLGSRSVSSIDDVKKCNPARFASLFQRLLARGIYFSPSQFEANFVSMAHTPNSLEFTKQSLLEALIEEKHAKAD